MSPPAGPSSRGALRSTLRLSVGPFRIEAMVEAPARPAPAGDALPALRAIVNAAVAEAERLSAADGKTISCQAGCGACCRQLVPVSRTEARALADLVAAQPKTRRAELRRRFADAAQRLEAAGLKAPLADATARGERATAELGAAYFALQIPCPFLENESCSIHPQRPLVCREYLVTSPAARCADPFHQGVDVVPTPALSHGARALEAGASDDDWMPLTLALDWAANAPPDRAHRTGPQWVEAFLSAATSAVSRPSAPPAPAAVSAPLRTATVALGAGETTLRLAEPAIEGPAALALPAARAIQDAAVAVAEKAAARDGRTVSCKAGCAACCRQAVAISETEAFAIADLVAAMPDARRAEIERRFADASARLGAAGLRERLREAGDAGAQGAAVTALGYEAHRLKIACPFLEDESCSIYSDRPLACRVHAVTSPPPLCDDIADPAIRALPVASALPALQALTTAAGEPRRWVVLALAMEATRERPRPSGRLPLKAWHDALLAALPGAGSRSP